MTFAADSTIPVPQVRIRKDWRGRWGVQVKWPRSGPWHRTLRFPRWCWHGPFGRSDQRWPSAQGALDFAVLLENLILRFCLRSGLQEKRDD